MGIWKKKSNVTTEPLVPEAQPARDNDVVVGEPAAVVGVRGSYLPPARKNFIDFPPQWREKQCIMTTWCYYSTASMLLCFCCPYGGILGIIGGSVYNCNCCLPKKEVAGTRAAFCIYIFAFAALILDIMIAIVLVALGAFYLMEECPYSESLCDLRSVTALAIFTGSGLIFLRFIISLNVFLSMRDYRREIQRENRLAQQLKEETEARFKQYAKEKQKAARHSREQV